MKEKNQSNIHNQYRSLLNESLGLLEWDILKTHLASFASTEMGKKAILDFEIPLDYESSQRLLNETIELNDLEKNLDKCISFSGVYDIEKNLDICFKGGVIDSSALLEIAETINSARQLKKILVNAELRPCISSVFNGLVKASRRYIFNGGGKNAKTVG